MANEALEATQRSLAGLFRVMGAVGSSDPPPDPWRGITGPTEFQTVDLTNNRLEVARGTIAILTEDNERMVRERDAALQLSATHERVRDSNREGMELYQRLARHYAKTLAERDDSIAILIQERDALRTRLAERDASLLRAAGRR